MMSILDEVRIAYYADLPDSTHNVCDETPASYAPSPRGASLSYR